jgi:NAD(P)-dependent dehydrogenase (short-subunit alcohol dehydrogenase family)
VVLAARREEALTELARQRAERGVEALAVPTDVSDPAAVDELARRAVERFGRIDVWVNNAAVTVFGTFEETPVEDIIRRVLDVDVMGTCTGPAALPHLREQGGACWSTSPRSWALRHSRTRTRTSWRSSRRAAPRTPPRP